MMDLKTIRTELRKLTAIVDGWESSGEIPALERDLALQKLRTLYDAFRGWSPFRNPRLRRRNPQRFP